MTTAVQELTTMRVQTLIKGEIEVPLDAIITFVEPPIGFSTTRFVILQTTPGPLYWLQGVDDPHVLFCVMAPFEAGLDPDLEIPGECAHELGAADAHELDVFTLVVLDQDPQKTRTNLRAPILVGKTTRLAKQVVLEAQHLPVQFFLHSMKTGKL